MEIKNGSRTFRRPRPNIKASRAPPKSQCHAIGFSRRIQALEQWVGAEPDRPQQLSANTDARRASLPRSADDILNRLFDTRAIHSH